MIKTKRIYEKPLKSDGKRILVDRLWPRGLKKEDARLDAWLKDLAPSNELRKWIHEDRLRWPEFESRYRAELNSMQESVAELAALARAGTVTLLFAALDAEKNNATVLAAYLRERL